MHKVEDSRRDRRTRLSDQLLASQCPEPELVWTGRARALRRPPRSCRPVTKLQ
jgi:hypothetical protein